MPGANKIYFANLDAIRFFAALMVYVSHGISPAYEFLDIKGTFLDKFLRTISSGGTGVSIFFVLSGFLITYLLLSEKIISGSISIRNFYVRRVLRIWPLYFATVLFTFGIYPFFKTIIGYNSELGSNVLYHLCFLSNFDVLNILQNCYGSDAMSQNITWSVSIEEQFYFFWPILIAVSSNRFLPFWIFTIIAFSLGFRIYHHADENILYYHTFAVFIDLAMGAIFAYATLNLPAFQDFFTRTSTLSHLIFLSATLTWFLFKNDIFKHDSTDAINRIISAFLIATVITSQSFGSKDSALGLGKIRFADRWGKYTYGIYMLHPICLLFLDVTSRIAGLDKNYFIAATINGIIGFILTLLLSAASYELFESKFLKLKTGFSVITKE